MPGSDAPIPLANDAINDGDVPGMPIVSVQAFIEATRDSGYKSTSAAIAELVDNAIEAGASTISVNVAETFAGGQKEISLSVLDDGSGMSPDILELALQFGGSTRFGSRKGSGRYGMGLPNGSLSQARRVEVVSWERPDGACMSYLDVDEIASGQVKSIPRPRRVDLEAAGIELLHGTLVTLRRCDRLDFKRAGKLISRLRLDLGRLFRRFVVRDRKILINGESVTPIDPTFQLQNSPDDGAKPFGPPLEYNIRYSDHATGAERRAEVTVVFVELPLEAWHDLSNEDKNRRGIAKGAGVAIMRAGREIDYGWFFMGSKRRENYDDWWRCEISFSPELDELFGVTHTKQRIRPDEKLVALLTPDIERIARELNNRVRKLYANIRAQEPRDKLLEELSRKDSLLEPPSGKFSGRKRAPLPNAEARRGIRNGMSFTIEHDELQNRVFYEPIRKGSRLILCLNKRHPFFRQVLNSDLDSDPAVFRRCLQTILLAAARSEVTFNRSEREIMRRFRQSWSDSLVAFLT